MKNIKTAMKKIFMKKEKGIALLFTLGMLSLLLVLALSFASNSKMANKVSANMDNRTASNYLAQSALNRAMGFLYKIYNTSSTTAISFEDIISRDASVNSWDYLYLINTVQNGQVIYNKIEDQATFNCSTSTTTPNWIYVREGTGASDKIIGRMAYVVVQDSGRIDPSATALTPGATPDEESTSPKPRPGREVYEMRLMDVDSTASAAIATTGIVTPGSVLTAARAKALGTASVSTRWGSLERIFNVLSLTVATTNDTIRKKLADWFIVDNAPDPEAFWKDDNGNGLKATTELYHRFNLYRSDWNSVTPAILIAAPAKFTDPFSTSAGIPWLQNWTPAASGCSQEQIVANIIDYCDNPSPDYATTGSFTIGNAPAYVGLEKCPYINEVEVTLNSPTVQTDDDILLPGTKNFSMALGVDINVEVVNLYEGVTATAPVYIDMEGSFDWNIAGTAPRHRTFSTSIVASTTNQNIGTSLGNIPNANNNYTYSKFTPAKVLCTFSDSVSLVTGSAINTITSFQVTKLYVRLGADATTLYDFAKIITDSPVVNNISIASVATGAGSRYFDFQVNDPRQNLEPSEWLPIPDLTAGAMASNTSLGAMNSTAACKPQNTGATDDTSKNEDWEPALVAALVDGSNGVAGTKCNISTAYIRNGRMQSPWELGAIHRGKAWQTLNIHTYYNAPTTTVAERQKAGVTPGTYAQGDANILDMVKLIDTTVRPVNPQFDRTGNELYTYGKINLNTPIANSDAKYADIFRPLFTGIKIDNGTTTPTGAYNDPANPTTCTYIISAIANQLASTTTGIRAYTTANGLFKRRSEVTKVTELTAIWAAGGALNTIGNKRRQDELIGKFINLTKAENVNEVTIIAVAQSIKDVGGVGADMVIPKDIEGTGSIAVAVNTANEVYGYKFKLYDAVAGTYSYKTLTTPSIPTFSSSDPKGVKAQIGRYDPYADEILSTQKILATVVYDTVNKKFKITKFQYLNP